MQHKVLSQVPHPPNGVDSVDVWYAEFMVIDSRDYMSRKVVKRRPEEEENLPTFMGVLILVIVGIAFFFILWTLRPYVSTEPLVSFW